MFSFSGSKISEKKKTVNQSTKDVNGNSNSEAPSLLKKAEIKKNDYL